MTGGYAMLFLDQAPIFFADKMPWQVPVQGEVVEAFAQGADTCFNHVCVCIYLSKEV